MEHFLAEITSHLQRIFRALLSTFPFLGCVLAMSFSGVVLARQAMAAPDANAPISNCVLLQELVAEGLAIGDSGKVVLDAPSLSWHPTQVERVKAASVLAGEIGWEAFARESPVAPIRLAIRPLPDDGGQRVGYEVHAVYMVHATLAQLQDPILMERLLGSPSESKQESPFSFREIETNELQSLGFEPQESRQAWAHVEVSILNKVRLLGTLRMERDKQPGQLDIAWILDDQIGSEHLDYRAVWRPLAADDLGNLVPGPESIYRGTAGYVRLIQIDPTAPGVMIEMRWVVHEPHAWFDGGNLMRAKLPLLIQENIRSFRRKLMVAKES